MSDKSPELQPPVPEGSTPGPSEPFRILSINAGGVRALFPAHYLHHVSQDTTIGQFWKKFDLIIGTSSGAIVAAALCDGKTPNDIATMITHITTTALTADIRTRAASARRFVHQPDLLKYFGFLKKVPLINKIPMIKGIETGIGLKVPADSNTAMKEVLEQNFSGKLGKFQKPTSAELAVTATDLKESNIRAFSKMTKDRDADLSVVDILMASTALPGVFPAYTIKEKEIINKTEAEIDRHYIDGYLWANAPLLAAVVLAIHKHKCAPDNIRVVSIGTSGRSHDSTPEKYAGLTPYGGKYNDYLAKITRSASEHVAHAAVSRLIGAENVLHVDDKEVDEISELDLPKAIKLLPNAAEECAKEKRMLRLLITS